MTLTDFLLARITEDEAIARNALAAEINTVSHEHVARWDPERVLAESAGKRSILTVVETSWDAGGGYDQEAFDARLIAHAMAQPYADHPDYQQEWKP